MAKTKALRSRIGSHEPVAIDRHALYEIAVQAPRRDARLLVSWFRRETGRPLRVLREDFCGTAAISCAFLRGGRGKEQDQRRAIGVDHDAATIEKAKHNIERLPLPMRPRARLVCADVRKASVAKADLVVALNFSYCVFHERAALLTYLKCCRRALRRGGAVVLDVFGGGLSHRPFSERFDHGAFAHEWEQRAFDPATHRVDCRIHFDTPQGRIDSAFVYDWRMWTVPELVDLMRDAGFASTSILWQDPRTGAFRNRSKGPADPHWLAYVTARRD